MKCVSDLSSTWKLAPLKISSLSSSLSSSFFLQTVAWGSSNGIFWFIFIWLLLYPCKNSSTQFYSTKSRTKRSNKGVHQSRSAVYTRSNCNSSPILAWDGAWNYASAVKIKQTSYSLGCRQHIISWTFKQKYCPVCLLVQQIIYTCIALMLTEWCSCKVVEYLQEVTSDF